MSVTTQGGSGRQYATNSGRQCTCSGHVTGSGHYFVSAKGLAPEKSHKMAL